jgi:hypothetical protein
LVARVSSVSGGVLEVASLNVDKYVTRWR